MSGIVEHGNNYYIARVNRETGEKTFLYYSRSRDISAEAYGFEQATRYDTLEEANNLIREHNALAAAQGGLFYYYCCNLKTECVELDADGNPFNPEDVINREDEENE